MSVDAIDDLARAYADRRQFLAGHLSAFERELAAVRKRYARELKRRVSAMADAESRLRNAVSIAPELFERPKTLVLHGIKVGYQKGKGKIEWEDDAMLVALIKKRFPDHVDDLVITTETPSKTGLKELKAEDLRRMGVTVEETGDYVVVKPVETDVEKLVKALLKDALAESEGD